MKKLINLKENMNKIVKYNSLLFLFSLISVLAIFSCNQKRRIGEMDKGAQVYRDKCFACHGNDKNNSNYDPALFEMIKFDKVELDKKIDKALNDTNHKKDVELTDDEKTNLKYFISNYDGTIY
jgi:cytochrome c2